jgi:hypothetical protein
MAGGERRLSSPLITAQMNHQFKALFARISWAVYGLCGLILAFFISWLLLAKVNFAYGWFHDRLDITQVTQQYGPLNRYRQGFEHTSKAERVRLFAAINQAIHQQGRGLGAIRYHDEKGKAIAPLLHQAEIIHLNDVAKLLEQLKIVVIIAAVLWLVLVLAYRFGWVAMPGFRQLLLSMVLLMLVMAMTVLLSGPVKIFYGLHEWFFPAGHQWFFYYEDSLMSTLMKAPDLFGGIAILLSTVALSVFALLNAMVFLPQFSGALCDIFFEF